MSTNHAKCAISNPAPYAGTVTKARTPQAAGEQWSVVRAATYFDLPPLMVHLGDWAICRDGIHSLYVEYFIPKDRFDEIDWIDQVTNKISGNKEDIISIFEMAKKMVALKMI